MANEILPPEAVYFNALGDYWRILTMRAVAEMSIADHLKDGPLAIDALADKSQAHPPTLYRVMRAMANAGFFIESPGKTFTLTPVGQFLRSDIPSSFRSMILSEFEADRVPAWHNLPHSIRTGNVAFDKVYGKDVWQHYREHPTQNEYFAKWMTQASRVSDQAIFAAFDFTPFKTVIDVGGGQGMFLTDLLDRYPASNAVLFDQPEVIALAPEHPRLRRVGGSFFESIPNGGDLYTMKWIIHDWEESKALLILQNIRKAMKPTSKLMLIEMLIKDGPEPDFVKWMDLNMLAIPGGQERTADEYRQLLAQAGFKLDHVIATQGMPTLLISAQT